MNPDARRRWWRDPDKLIPLALFVVVSSVYFATLTGITDGNAGSHYAATRALADTGHLDIAGFDSFTQMSDYALGFDGATHSDRPPATALLAAATYRLGSLLPEPRRQVPSLHDGENPRVIWAVLAAVLTGATSIILFYAILRQHFETSATAALLASLALAFGTTVWKYSSTLYHHSPAALFALLAVYLALRAARQQYLAWPGGLLLGFSLGAAVLADYMNAVLVVLSLVYLGVALARPFRDALRSHEQRPDWLKSLGALALGSAVPAAFFLAYNKILFGGYLQLGIYWVDPVLWSCCTTFAKNFSTPLLDGLQGMLFYGNRNQGIFLLTPVAILAPLSWLQMARRSRRDFIFLIGTFVVLLLAFSKNATVNPDTDDSRYLTNFLGLWYLPLGLWLDHYALRRESHLARLAVFGLYYGLLFLSIRNMFMHIAFSWNHDLRLDTLIPKSTPPENVTTLLQTVFRNTANLPLLWLFEGLAFVLIGAVWGLWKTFPARLGQRAVMVIGTGALALVAGGALAARMLSAPVPPPGMTPLTADFDAPGGGTLYLVGYRIVDWTGRPEPSDPLYLRLYWQAEGPVPDDTRVSLRLVTGDGGEWGESESPLGSATWRVRPPDTWRAGEVFQEQYVVPTVGPADEDRLATVWLALESPDGERLPLSTSGADSLPLVTAHPATWEVAAE